MQRLHDATTLNTRHRDLLEKLTGLGSAMHEDSSLSSQDFTKTSVFIISVTLLGLLLLGLLAYALSRQKFKQFWAERIVKAKSVKSGNQFVSNSIAQSNNEDRAASKFYDLESIDEHGERGNDQDHDCGDHEFAETDSLLNVRSYGSIATGGHQNNSASMLSTVSNKSAKKAVANMGASSGQDTGNAESSFSILSRTPVRPQEVAVAHSSSPITPVSAAMTTLRDTSRDHLSAFASLAFPTDGRNAFDIDPVVTKFNQVLREGLVLSLYTTKGPKPVLFSLLAGELRWQAAKGANKRYKLHLRDVTTVEAGKRTSNFFTVGALAADDRCFSILTSGTTLDLEAASIVDRDCLVMGFRNAVEQAKRV